MEVEENGEDEMNEEGGEDELEEIIGGQKEEDDEGLEIDTELLRKKSIHLVKKQMSIQSARGGIQGNIGVIGEDGAMEKDSDEESSVENVSNNGMRTRLSRLRGRKKPSTEKDEVLALSRQGVIVNRQKITEETKQVTDGDPKTPPTKKLAKTVKKCNIPKPVQSSNNNSVSVGNGSQTDSMKTYDIKTNN